MKKFLIIILAIIIPSSLNAHPLGYGDKKVDYNYKCSRDSDGRTVKLGFKIYEFKKDGSKMLAHLTFYEKDKKYGIPDSEVKYWGSGTLQGVKYDHLQVWFRHTPKFSIDDYYLYRYILRIKGSNFSLESARFRSDKNLTNKLNEIDELVKKHINSDHDKTADYLRSYYNKSESYVAGNLNEKFVEAYTFTCALN